MAILGDSVPEVNRPSRNRVVRSCSAEAEGTQIGTSFPIAPRSSRWPTQSTPQTDPSARSLLWDKAKPTPPVGRTRDTG